MRRPQSEAVRRRAGLSLGSLQSAATARALTLVALLASTPAVCAQTLGEGSPATGSGVQLWAGMSGWIMASYQQAPALVLGLAALLAVPPLALVGLWATRRERALVAVPEARTKVLRGGRRATRAPRESVKTGYIPAKPHEAWIEILNGSEVAPRARETRFPVKHVLLRIGRESDNDICLEDVTVHRYHAAIHLTEDAEFMITDLSSESGNGVVVNGRAVAEARLKAGDQIELGKAQLRFTTGKVDPA